jgi:hypothetical protein
MALGRLMLTAGAAGAGLAVGWLATSGLAALMAGAGVVAVMNGYSKAYSP